MKKLLTLFALMLLCIGQTFAYDFEVDGIYYNKSGSNATVTYKTSSYNSYSGIVIIPATVTYDGVTYSVTSIGTYAFSYCDGLTSIIIPSSVTSIGERAFACSGLTSITIPNSVKSIGELAFWMCSGLTSVTIPSSVTTIEKEVFLVCDGLTSVTIPNSVTSIGEMAFGHCSSLTSITIPSSVENIGQQAFYQCTGLTSVTIPNSVTSIGAGPFSGCDGLTSITVASGNTKYDSRDNCNGIIETATNTLIQGCNTTSIPSSVTSIAKGGFYDFQALTSVTIPSSVTSIGVWAFNHCINLTSVTNLATIPQTVGSGALSNLATLHVKKGYKDVFAAAPFWSKFTIVDDVSDYSNIPINDGVSYTSASNYTYDELIYTRNFSSTNWQALYVPFSMKYDDWKDYMDVYDIYNVLAYDEDNNGEIERTTVNMIRLKEGAVTEPNYPYVVRAKNAGDVEITLTDGMLYAAEENSIDCTSTKQKFTFTGTYEPMTGLYTKGCYALDGGVLKTAIDDAVTLKPQRWYMEVTNRDGSPTAATRVYLNPFGEEDEVEGVKGVAVNIIGEETTYDMGGRSVNAAQLPKGLYVRGGKKIIVK